MLVCFIAVMLAGGMLTMRVGAKGGCWCGLPYGAATGVDAGVQRSVVAWPGLATVAGIYLIALGRNSTTC